MLCIPTPTCAKFVRRGGICPPRAGALASRLMWRFWKYPPVTGPVFALLSAGLLVVLVFAAWVFLEACGVVLPFRPWLLSACPAAASAETGPESERVLGRRAVLEERIAGLETRLARMRCLPPPPPPPPVGGLDAEQWAARDIRVLEGCWQLDSDYEVQEIRTRVISKVVDWRMCFNAEGSGDQDFRFDSGTTCESGSRARFNDAGQLVILDPGNVHCSDNSCIFRREIVCDLQQDGTADCLSTQPERGSGHSSVTIRKP